MAVTRIKNNQITDNTIEYQKLKDGTLVGAKFNSNLTLNSNVSIVGNLQVTGNTTTVNSINTLINDPIVIFNNGYVGVPSYDVGMLVNRNLSSLGTYGSLNTAFVWSETDEAFIAVLTSETGTTTGVIDRSYFANAKVGNLIAVHSANVGSMLSGQILASGNIVAASGTASSSYVTGAIVVPGGGGVGITGALNVQGTAGFLGNITAGNINLSGNINVPVGGTFSNTGVFFGNAGGIGALYAGTTGYSPLPTTVLQLSGNVDTYAQVNFQNINNGSSASTDYVATADNGSDTDGYVNVGINSSTFSDPSLPHFGPNDGYLLHHGVGQVGNLLIVNHTEGLNSGISFAVGGSDLGNVKAAFTHFGQIIFANTASVDQYSGALQVLGGVGIAGNLHAVAINGTPIGNTVPSTGAFTSLTVNGAAFTNVSSGNAVITGGYINNLANLTATDAILTTGVVTNFSTANAVVTGGYITGLANLATTGVTTSGGNLVAAATTTSTSTTTGALVVIGGAGIGGNVNIGEDLFVTGNLTVQGTSTTLNTSTLDVEDKNITIAKGAVNSAAADGAGLTVDGANATFTYASTGDQFVFNKTVKAPTLNATANVYLKPQDGAATVTIEPLVIGTIDNMSIGSISAANVVASGLRATTSLFAAPTGTIWLRGGTGTNGINNIPIGAVTPAAGTFTTAAAQTTNSTTLNVTNGNVTTLVATNLSSGNVLIAGGVIYNVNVQANNISTANALITSSETTTGVVTNFSSGNVVITGGYAVNLTGGTAANIANDSQTLRVNDGGMQIIGDSYIGGDLGINESLRVVEVSLLNGNVLANSRVTTNYTAAAGTASTSGALVIPGTGGAAIGGNLYVGQGAVINGSQSVHDTIIRGVNERSLVYAVASATYDQVVIGGNITAANVTQGAKFQVVGTDAMIIPSGFTSQRPGSAGYTDIEGMLRFNKTLTSLEFFDGTIWQGTGTSFTVITSTLFSGANVDGVNVEFTLPASATTNGTIVSINGVVQIPTSAYSITGNLVTFTEAPAVGDVIDVRTLTTTAQVTTLASDNGFNQVILDNNYVSVWTGTSSTTERWRFNTTGDFVPATTANIGSNANRVNYLFASNIDIQGGAISGVSLGGGSLDNTVIGGNIAATGTFTTLYASNLLQTNAAIASDDINGFYVAPNSTDKISSFDKTVYRSGKFFVQLSDEGGTEYQAAEVLVVHDGTTASIEVYGVTYTGAANLATFSSNVAGSVINLNASSAGANLRAKVTPTLMRI